MMSLTSSGRAVIKIDMITVLIQTDLPEPVAPVEDKQDGSKAVVMGVDGKSSATLADWLYPKP